MAFLDLLYGRTLGARYFVYLRIDCCSLIGCFAANNLPLLSGRKAVNGIEMLR